MPYQFPPLADTLSAATMEIFAYRLGWLDPIDAFHMLKVLLSGLLLLILYWFAASRLGKLPAFLAVLLLSTYPRFWGDLHFNPKDVPEAAFFAFTIFAYVAWYETPSWRSAFVAGIVLGAALSIKANALFVPIVLALGVLPWQFTRRPWAQVVAHMKSFVGHYVMMLVCAIATQIILWPYVYPDVLRLRHYYTFAFSQGGRPLGTLVWNWDPLFQAITTMPEVTLVLVLIGFGCAIWRSRKLQTPIWRLVLVWLLVPILRVSMPGTHNYDGIRLFEEFIPAACILAGCGGETLVNLLAQGNSRRKIPLIIGLIVFVAVEVGFILAQYRPYEYIYYNSLAGGLSGAHDTYKIAEATDYWASSYRQGMKWLNVNAPNGAGLFVPTADWVASLTAPIWLRKDLVVIQEGAIKDRLQSGEPIYVMFITRPWLFNTIVAYCTQRLKPVYQIVIDNVQILVIYRLDSSDNVPE